MANGLPNSLKALLAEGAKSSTSQWWECAQSLAALFDDRREAAGQLKALFQREEKIRPYLNSYRSKILTLAYPTNRDELADAYKEKEPINSLLKIARGNSGSTRGGHNRKSPSQNLTHELAKAFKVALQKGLDASEIRRITLKCLGSVSCK